MWPDRRPRIMVRTPSTHLDMAMARMNLIGHKQTLPTTTPTEWRELTPAERGTDPRNRILWRELITPRLEARTRAPGGFDPRHVKQWHARQCSCVQRIPRRLRGSTSLVVHRIQAAAVTGSVCPPRLSPRQSVSARKRNRLPAPTASVVEAPVTVGRATPSGTE